MRCDGYIWKTVEGLVTWERQRVIAQVSSQSFWNILPKTSLARLSKFSSFSHSDVHKTSSSSNPSSNATLGNSDCSSENVLRLLQVCSPFLSRQFWVGNVSVNAQGWHTRRYLENDRLQVRRKYTFERELEGTDSSSERAAIEYLRNWGAAE